MKWKDSDILSIDTETTGVRRGHDRIIEIGAYHPGSGAKLGQLINPQMPIPAEASKVHDIYDSDIQNMPTIADIADSFLDRIRDAEVLVCYNWPFDAGMLEAELGKAWTDAIEGKPVIDPLVIVRMETVGKYWKGVGRHRLGNVAKRLGVERKGKGHRASSDAQLSYGVLMKVAEHISDYGHEAHNEIVYARQCQDEEYNKWKKNVSRT